ncbi:MAG: carbamoyl phosphate synthase large subunit [Deltaproteobacteria bacterium CG11_big_fil_rev_8_21_14_0_20_49_13]|nr:MAG: carbamoyl phosphate synthase large subunit [Deltaproteobacteria bacterium CG11_big_fil_rev_8_21_14_0_20_49_13]
MPKRTDIHKILLIGSGPIIIGQACEFDYSGTQACKALKEEGFNVVLVNSNPATIMTDPELADATYIEPLTLEYLTKIIEKERPDAILPTIGGQTGLNLSVQLAEAGVLKKYNVELLGANLEAIKKAEDRQLFKDAMEKIGLTVPKSVVLDSLEKALKAEKDIGLPAIIRPAFTLGGSGGNIAYTKEEFKKFVEYGLMMSPIHQILLEESVLGWKEFELEVMRDKNDNVVIICSIENLDPMGIHTGDSITVAPAQTLTDREYQYLRDASIKVIREIGVDTGGSNIQFGVNPVDGRVVVIEMNPRVSRSSALASKATGFPIAKIATKLAVGYTLDELPNDITRETMASFEPTIDYVVTKIPRFAFEKFPHTKPLLTTQMKSVGEAMAIGRTFEESLLKALRSLECGWKGLDRVDGATPGEILKRLREAMPDRILWLGEAFRQGIGVEEAYEITKIDRWFLYKIKALSLRGAEATKQSPAGDCHAPSGLAMTRSYRSVDTCAAEFIAYTPYFYSTMGEDDDHASCIVPHASAEGSTKHETGSMITTSSDTVVILGSGPNRIGQGVEFDYSCVQASKALKEIGVKSVMVNCNPETVSTDYDTSDKLYFEPLTLNDVLPIIERERPKGVIIQFGGQTPLKLSLPLKKAGVPILGTDPEDIDRAEDRKLFNEVVRKLNLKQPEAGTATNIDEALEIAERIGYPVLVRPSYVLGGRAMELVFDRQGIEFYMKYAVKVSPEHPVLVDRFLNNAIEVDVDAVSDGAEVFVAGIMEHIEEAGIHSGDSSCVLPPHTLSKAIISEIERETVLLARALNVVGLMNIQFAIYNKEVYILEVNPRASRTVPFVSKAIGIPLARIATKVMMGHRLKDLLPVISNRSSVVGNVDHRASSTAVTDYRSPITDHYSVKTPVFPFNKFPGVDSILGPEMKSTGEVMGIADTVGEAFAKAQEAAGNKLPSTGTVFISIKDADKEPMAGIATLLVESGFKIVATRGTRLFLLEKGIPAVGINKFREGHPNIVEAMEDGKIALVINTTAGKPSVGDSYIIRRTAIERKIPYFTTIEGAGAFTASLGHLKSTEEPNVRSLQEYHLV